MQVKTQLNTPHHAQLESMEVEHDLFFFLASRVDEKERARYRSTLPFGLDVPLHDSGEGLNGHTVRRNMLCVGPKTFSHLVKV